jgi:hypothetical protein
LTTLAGRSTTSPAATWLARMSGKMRIFVSPTWRPSLPQTAATASRETRRELFREILGGPRQSTV